MARKNIIRPPARSNKNLPAALGSMSRENSISQMIVEDLGIATEEIAR